MLLSYRRVHSVQHILTDRLQLATQPFGLCLTLDHELAVSGLAAIVRKAQKVEGLRATLPGSCSALGSEPPKLDQPGFALVDRQAELHQPVSQRREEPFPPRPTCRIKFAVDLYGAFPVKRLFWVVLRVFCSEREKAVFRPVACNQVPERAGRAQGTETQ